MQEMFRSRFASDYINQVASSQFPSSYEKNTLVQEWSESAWSRLGRTCRTSQSPAAVEIDSRNARSVQELSRSNFASDSGHQVALGQSLKLWKEHFSELGKVPICIVTFRTLLSNSLQPCEVRDPF